MLFFIHEGILLTGLFIPNEKSFILPDFPACHSDDAGIK